MTVKLRKPNSEADQLFADLDKPSLGALSYILRHPDTWPEDFIWNYSKCDMCAMGLAHRLWNFPETDKSTAASIMARKFGIPYQAAESIFMGKECGLEAGWLQRSEEFRRRSWLGREYTGTRRYSINISDVTPDMVADIIDAYLARAE